MEQTLAEDARWHPVVRALVFLVVYFILMSIVEAGVIILFAGLNHLSLQEMQQIILEGNQMGYFVVMKLFELIVLLLLAWIFGRTLDRIPVKDFGFTWYPREFVYGTGYGILLISGAYILYLIFGLAKITGIGTEGLNTGQLVIQIILGFIAFVFGSIQEELLLRGYVLRNFMQSMRNWFAVIITGLIFALLHFFNPNMDLLGLINIFLAGVLFGVYYIHRRNLWFPIGLHLTWNFFQGTVYGIPVSGKPLPSIITSSVSGPKLLSGGGFGIEASIIGTVVLLIGIVGFQIYYSKHPEIPE